VLENNIQYSYQSLDNKFIDIYGIKVANEKVLENSISSVYETGDSVYVDHFKIKKYNSISLIRGEDNCRAIALASIIAKVIRDEYMIEISNSYSNYHLHNNKGYGTKEHRKAISKYGLSDIHRKSFNLMPK
jgi:ribonuclease HII